jgi:DNA-binding CsgD family transcriptional regulator
MERRDCVHRTWNLGESIGPQKGKFKSPARAALKNRSASTAKARAGQFKTRTLCKKRKGCGTPNCNTETQENNNSKPKFRSQEKRPDHLGHPPDAHKRCFDVVAVWRFDRFARSVSHLLRALETFSALGIAFVSLNEQMDTTTPTGKMVFTVLGAVAELERSLIAERVRAGLRNARAKGKRLGRPRLSIDATSVERLRVQGRTIREIAEALGVSRSLVHKTLANQTPICDAIAEG